MFPSRTLTRFRRNLWLTLSAYVVFAIVFAIYIRSEYQINLANELRHQSLLLVDELRQSSEDLTLLVRTYAVTGDIIYQQRYREILDIRAGKRTRFLDLHNIYWNSVLPEGSDPPSDRQAIALLELMRLAGFTQEEFARLAQAKINFDLLTQTEDTAMELIATTTPPNEDNRTKAQEMLFGTEYFRAKTGIMQPLGEFREMVNRRTLEAVRVSLNSTAQIRRVLIAIGLLLLFMLWQTYRALHFTLGGSLNELYRRIALLAGGNFSSPIPVAQNMKNSVLGRLSETQNDLDKLDRLRKDAETRNQNLAKLYKALSQCNQAILRSAGENDLFHIVCRHAVTINGIKMAWIGLLDEPGKQIEPIAAYGNGAEYLENIRISVNPNEPDGQEPAGIAVSEDRPYWCQDFQHDPGTAAWRLRGAKSGWGSSAALPLHRNGVIIGAFALYSDKPNTFDEYLQNLLVEIAIDIDYALNNFQRETQRKLTEASLREVGEQFRSITDNAGAVIFLKDLKGRFLLVNKRFEQLFHLTDEKIRGKTDYDVFPTEMADAFAGNDQAVIQSGQIVEAEVRVTHDDGFHTYNSIKFPLRKSAGEIYAVCGIATDITERKQAEESLRESEQRLRTVIETEPECVKVIDKTIKLLEINPAGLAMFEADSLEEILRHTFTDFILPEYRAAFIDLHKRVMDGEHGLLEFEISGLRGTRRWLETHAAPLRDANGEITLLLGVTRDITRRKKAEALLADSRNLLQTIIDTTPVRVFWKDKDLRYLGCNPAFARDAGEPNPQDIIGKDDYQLSWKENAELYRADDRQVMSSGIPKLFYDEPQTKTDGNTIWLRTSKVPLWNDKQETIGVLGIYEDITEHKHTELALQLSEANLKRAQAVARIGSWQLDLERNMLKWSDETYRMFGIPSGTPLSYRIFLQHVHPEDVAALDVAWKTVLKGSPYRLEYRIAVNGETYWVEECAEPEFDATGKVCAGIGTVQDITDRKRAEERLKFLAHCDTLTGLPNRTQLDDRVKYALSFAKRSNGHLALMFLDLDHFKNINDTLGHSVGDTLLIELAKRLRLALREEDTLSRLGGDEFILLFPGTDAQGASQVAQKLLEIIAEPYRIKDYDLNVTASIGIAVYPNDGDNLEILSKNADAAMYRAKHEGRHGYRFFTQEMQGRLARQLQIVNALRHALEHDQLQIYYQPQITIQSGRIIGAEALLRWQHPELGSISPVEFIPAAEDSGLILPIGEWVMRHAVRQAKTWMLDHSRPLIISVNLSSLQFRHPDLPNLVTQILIEESLPPECLELELTEDLVMRNPKAAIGVMISLHERGVLMSLDDFGTGYSSLSYLKKFKVYKLKIDKSFVRNLNTNPENKAIVSAIISLARSLDLKTIAEGVKTKNQLTFLREEGCDEAQGYLYSKPLPAEQFEAFLKAGQSDNA